MAPPGWLPLRGRLLTTARRSRWYFRKSNRSRLIHMDLVWHDPYTLTTLVGWYRMRPTEIGRSSGVLSCCLVCCVAYNWNEIDKRLNNSQEQDGGSRMNGGVPPIGMPISSRTLETERLGRGDGDGGSWLEWELEFDPGLSESLLEIFANSTRKSSSELVWEESGPGLDEVLLSEDDGMSFHFFIPIVLEHISPSSKSSHDRFQISGDSPSFSRCLQWSRSRNTFDLRILDGSAQEKPSG